VDITYGTDSSNLNGGGTVPWQANLPIPADAQFVTVSAQLQGPDGSISCTTTVTWNQNGAHTATKTGTAADDYNIASAEVCSGLSSGWEAC